MNKSQSLLFLLHLVGRIKTRPLPEAHQAFPTFTISLSLLGLMSIQSVMPSNHLIPCCPLLLLPSIIPSIRVFSNELALHIGIVLELQL